MNTKIMVITLLEHREVMATSKILLPCVIELQKLENLTVDFHIRENHNSE